MANMIINDELSDETILAELGQRLAQRRIARSLSQAALAAEAGVAKRTVERVEAGESVQLVTLVRLCRVLGLMDGLDQWLPETGLSPMALLKEKRAGKGRQRVRSHRTAPVMKTGGKPWTWGDSSS
ncbi:MAG: helix-turn-helix domain-containing protein [Nitrosomonas sp.]|nr:helix-turn-helix domain-containing protein [Nitrosomonas sp.]MBP6076818.1 helix-turn-helix domain-containing protein [Nitrosomonas sp.]